MTEHLWIVKIIFFVALLVVLNYSLKYFLKYWQRRDGAKKSSQSLTFEKVIYVPLRVALFITGFAYIIDVLGHRYDLKISPEYLTDFRNALIVGCVAWILLKWKAEAQKNLIRKAVDLQMIYMVSRILSIVIISVALLIILQLLGIDVMPLIAFGGIGAAAIGFASKDVIANFCSGLMIYVTRPFTVGEWIILQDKNLQGRVEEIGWYLTAIRDREKMTIYLPNWIFSQSSVKNASRMSHRRILEKIRISPDDFAKIKGLVEEIRKIVLNHPLVNKKEPIRIYFDGYNEYSYNIQLDVYTDAKSLDEALAIKHEMLLQIYALIAEKGAKAATLDYRIVTPSSGT